MGGQLGTGDLPGMRGPLSLHSTVRSWFAGLRSADPALARLVGVALLLLVIEAEPGQTVILAGWAEDAEGSADVHDTALPLAAQRLALSRQGPVAEPGTAADFVSYDAPAFLGEFFPGEETEVQLGAAALVARSRAHTLAEARQRLGLTQAQVAERMNVRQERVSAIERAEPGAAEIRTLAAYVRALGGRLEIAADIGADRILLR